ncbi:transposase [Alterinioella nitratireducens]|uniref:transposase n=1 Tax=Alterinioella nitratireducens TaxID=2735915 RepID=UPI001F34043A|nr:transposase [Alterinioella nitratireducens]
MTRKQTASLVGPAPMARQSGQWCGKAFIQGARKFLRDALYMAALVAARYNPDLRQKYQSMTQAGKPPRVALTALMRKLLELANTLIRKDRDGPKKPLDQDGYSTAWSASSRSSSAPSDAARRGSASAVAGAASGH